MNPTLLNIKYYHFHDDESQSYWIILGVSKDGFDLPLK